MKMNTELLACFFNDAINVAVSVMSPIWNGNQNLAYSLAVDGAGIIERAKFWSNEYITGARPKGNEYFIENLRDLKKDRRYVNNTKVQALCDKYLQVLEAQ
jgi:hypothetical protein